jgi:hypothetical protein
MPGHERTRPRPGDGSPLLDELGYERDGDAGRWRLVKRL